MESKIPEREDIKKEMSQTIHRLLNEKKKQARFKKEKQSYNQKEFAEKLGVSHPTFKTYLNPKKDVMPDAYTMRRIATELNVSVDELYGFYAIKIQGCTTNFMMFLKKLALDYKANGANIEIQTDEHGRSVAAFQYSDQNIIKFSNILKNMDKSSKHFNTSVELYLNHYRNFLFDEGSSFKDVREYYETKIMDFLQEVVFDFEETDEYFYDGDGNFPGKIHKRLLDLLDNEYFTFLDKILKTEYHSFDEFLHELDILGSVLDSKEKIVFLDDE
jgi:transcriptional regulator with XRE-family HTH domain